MSLISKLYGTKDLSHFSFEFYKKEEKKKQVSLTSEIWNSALCCNEQSPNSKLLVLLRDDYFAFVFLQ